MTKNIYWSSTGCLLFHYTPIYLMNTTSTAKCCGISSNWEMQWHLKFRNTVYRKIWRLA